MKTMFRCHAGSGLSMGRHSTKQNLKCKKQNAIELIFSDKSAKTNRHINAAET